MDSVNSQDGKSTCLNQAAENPNSVGGNKDATPHFKIHSCSSPSSADVAPSPSDSADTEPSVKENKRSAEPDEDEDEDKGGPSTSKRKVEPAGNLVLRERDVSAFPNPPKAYALIINIFHYKRKSDKETNKLKDKSRKGSQVDVENLAEKFKMFNVGVYTPKTYTNEENTVIYVTASDVQRWIKDFKDKMEEHKEQNGGNKMACFLCIMGHGTKDGRLVASRSKEKISIEKDIFPQFNNQNFKAMINNPKIFFINCCRGADDSERVSIQAFGWPDRSPSHTVPNHSDFLIFWATTPEHFSVRNTHEGSKFIQNLCTILQVHHDELKRELGRWHKEACYTGIETVLKAVTCKMGSFSFEKKGKEHSQTPNIDDRRFGYFLWLIDDFHYSQHEAFPSYLKKCLSKRETAREESFCSIQAHV